MAISKSGKTTSGPAPKAKTAGAGARKHAASTDQPNRNRGTTAGTAKSVAGRSSAAGKKTTRGPAHKSATRGRRLAPGREQLVMPVATPSHDQLRALDLIVNRGTEITIVHGKTSVKVTGETLAAMRQIIAALSAGPLSLLVNETLDTEITSQEAADLLNVSRPYVIKLARERRLAHRLVGNRHRFLLSDVQAFRQVQRQVSEQALAAMVPEGGYVDGDF